MWELMYMLPGKTVAPENVFFTLKFLFATASQIKVFLGRLNETCEK